MIATKRIVFPIMKQVRCEPFERRRVSAGELRVQSICSLISTGTEMTIFSAAYDVGTHWHNWVKYPFEPGYSTIGRVVEVGADTSRCKVGDVVGIRKPHASEHIVPETEAFVVPAGLSPEEAVWFALAKITYIGARAADYRLNDSAIIVGCGPIGQLSIRWAAQTGLRHLVAVDLTEARLPLARSGGASVTICSSLADAKQAIFDQCGQVPRIILDTTGNARVFGDALELSREYGRVVLLGDTGSPASQHLTPDVILKGLTITAGHDMHILHADAGPVYELFFQQVLAGRINLKGMISHRFRPEECSQAYETLVARRNETMGLLFEWE